MVRALEELADALSRLPTIGKKSAWRLAMFLLERDDFEVEHLASCIGGIKKKVTRCSSCFNYSETPVCSICSSTTRSSHQVCVVEKPVDVFTLERSGRYRGKYHVLGGVLSPINGVTADKLNIAALKARIEQEKPDELILALGGSAEAETTSLYLARYLADSPVQISQLARGLPAGLELEYVDQITLNQALQERTRLKYGAE
ncbi:MAG: recombination mediator RecR [Chitinispirillaceae bacterium]